MPKRRACSTQKADLIGKVRSKAWPTQKACWTPWALSFKCERGSVRVSHIVHVLINNTRSKHQGQETH
jgi:hypothetical protein